MNTAYQGDERVGEGLAEKLELVFKAVAVLFMLFLLWFLSSIKHPEHPIYIAIPHPEHPIVLPHPEHPIVFPPEEETPPTGEAVWLPANTGATAGAPIMVEGFTPSDKAVWLLNTTTGKPVEYYALSALKKRAANGQ